MPSYPTLTPRPLPLLAELDLMEANLEKARGDVGTCLFVFMYIEDDAINFSGSRISPGIQQKREDVSFLSFPPVLS